MTRPFQTMVLSFWKMLVNMMLSHFSALPIKLTVASILPLGIGTFLIKLQSQTLMISGSSITVEVLVWYVCTARQVEWLESTTVKYHIKMELILFMLEFIQPVQVSNNLLPIVATIHYFDSPLLPFSRYAQNNLPPVPADIRAEFHYSNIHSHLHLHWWSCHYCLLESKQS